MLYYGKNGRVWEREMSRERIYQLLRERPESFLSGPELSPRLGISTAAGWEAHHPQRRDG